MAVQKRRHAVRSVVIENSLQVVEQDVVRLHVSAPSRRPPVAAQITAAKPVSLSGKEFAHMKITGGVLSHSVGKDYIGLGLPARRPASREQRRPVAGSDQPFRNGKWLFFVRLRTERNGLCFGTHE